MDRRNIAPEPEIAGLHVVLPGWAVQSGDHPGFTTGETTSFALEFAPLSMSVRVSGIHPQPALEALGEDRYRAAGRVVSATRRLTVIDVGVVGAFAARPVAVAGGFLEAGDWFTGEIALAADPFTYRVFHAPSAGAADITEAWTVESIQVQVGRAGPWSPVEATTPSADSALYLLSIRPAAAGASRR